MPMKYPRKQRRNNNRKNTRLRPRYEQVNLTEQENATVADARISAEELEILDAAQATRLGSCPKLHAQVLTSTTKRKS